MAYQPIVNIDRLDVFAYEALVRSHNNKEDARGVLDCVPPTSSYAFDLACRSHALRLAIELDIQQSDAKLCLNLNPTAATQDASHLGLTCTEAIASGMALDRLIFWIIFAVGAAALLMTSDAGCDYPPEHRHVVIDAARPAAIL